MREKRSFNKEMLNAIRKSSTEALTSQALTAAKIAHRDINIVKWALTEVEKIVNSYDKAIVLSLVAQALTEASEPEKSQYILQLALDSARFAGTEAVLEILANGISTLAVTDQGQTLWRTYEIVQEINSWWEKH